MFHCTFSIVQISETYIRAVITKRERKGVPRGPHRFPKHSSACDDWPRSPWSLRFRGYASDHVHISTLLDSLDEGACIGDVASVRIGWVWSSERPWSPAGRATGATWKCGESGRVMVSAGRSERTCSTARMVRFARDGSEGSERADRLGLELRASMESGRKGDRCDVEVRGVRRGPARPPQHPSTPACNARGPRRTTSGEVGTHPKQGRL